MMRKEVENWLNQAKRDLQTANNSFHSGDYYACVFWCQQTVEKGLKALYIYTFNKIPPKVHDLTLLCDAIENLPENVRIIGEKLTPSYIFARYPDASNKIPADLYSMEQTKNFLKLTREAMLWIENKLK